MQERLVLDTTEFLNIIKQIFPIINLKGSKLSRGIVLKINKEDIKLIYPNELYYFKSSINAITNTFNEDIDLYLDYQFIDKLSKFIPQTNLEIYRKDNIFYIKLTTGDLEIINPNLLDSEKKKVNYEYILENTDAFKFKIGEIKNKLNSLYKITDFEIEKNKKMLNCNNSNITFISPLLFAKSNFNFIDVKLEYKVLSYLNYLCNKLDDNDIIEIYKVKSDIIQKYMITYKNTIFISNYPKCSEDIKLLSFFDNLPQFTIIDYADLKYKLEYAESIIYSSGVVTFINRDSHLIGKIKLNNGNESEVEIPVFGELYLKTNQQIRVNSKTLLVALSSLDDNLETHFGLNNGILYLINSDISLALMTF